MIVLWFVLQGLGLVVVNEGRYRKPFEGLLIAQLLLLAGSFRPQGLQTDAPLAKKDDEVSPT